MSFLQTILCKISEIELLSYTTSSRLPLSPAVKIVVTILFLILLLALPLRNPVPMLYLFIYPIVLSSLYLLSYIRLLRYSLVILPFLLLIGIANPFMDQETAFYVGSVAISRGWTYFIAILLRGLLSMQATLLLMLTTPFSEICIGLRALHVPKIFISILEMIYRYLWVILREAVSMEMARRARSYDRKHFSLKLWGIFVAQLLMRSIDRAERITQAMQARLA